MSLTSKDGFCKALYISSFALLGLFIFLEHTDFARAIKNASLYIALFFALIYSALNPKIALDNLKQNAKSAKLGLIFGLCFILYVFGLSYAPYDDNYPSLLRAFRHFGRALAFLLVILLVFNGSKKPILWLFSSFVAAFIVGSADDAYLLLGSLSNVSSHTYEQARLVSRGYADFVDRFLPLGLCAVLLATRLRYKVLIGILCVLVPLILDIFTGARGSWLACIITLTLFALLSQKERIKSLWHKHLRLCLASIVCLLGLGVLLVSHSTVLQYKLAQGFDSSGRTQIIKERSLGIANANRLIFGLGYGKEQYDSALIAADAKGLPTAKKYGTIDDGRQNYWNDEPFFLGYFYYYGIFGVACIFALFIYVLIASFKGFKHTQSPLFLAVFLSTIAYFGLRGLFECYNLRALYLFYLLGLLMMSLRAFTKDSNEKCTNS